MGSHSRCQPPCHPHLTDEEAEAQGGYEVHQVGLFLILCSLVGPSLPWDQPVGQALSPQATC